jgi:hypothetical protein
MTESVSVQDERFVAFSDAAHTMALRKFKKKTLNITACCVFCIFLLFSPRHEDSENWKGKALLLHLFNDQRLIER